MPTSTGRRWHARAERFPFVSGLLAAAALLTPGLPPAAAAAELAGFAALELRAFADDPTFEGQDDGLQASLVLEPEYYWESEDGDSSFEVKLFGRLDSADPERSHFDVRELHWRRSGPSWELLVGVSKVFWGVTESQHLVDIVNQTDLIENPDGEDKLGQPMVKLSLIRRFGIFDLFVLPGFRERTFPGVEGRLRAPLPVTDDAIYESSAEEDHVDWAARWSHAVGPFDIGLSHFSGTSREPRFLTEEALRAPTTSGELSSGPASLVPLYEQIDQTGLDLQATTGSWLWKLEAISRLGQLDRFTATTAGFEYTFWGVFGSSVDVGALGEHLWDERGEAGPSAFQNDVFLGTRIALNDAQDTSVLAGAILDTENDGRSFLIEASRRFGSSWILEAEVRTFDGAEPTDPLSFLRSDDYLQISLQRHF